MPRVGEQSFGAETALQRGGGPAGRSFAGAAMVRFGGLVVPLLLVGDVGEGDEGKESGGEEGVGGGEGAGGKSGREE